MNRRQAKKRFKKKYGVTPEQMAETMRYAVSPEVLSRIVDAATDIARALVAWAEEVAARLSGRS